MMNLAEKIKHLREVEGELRGLNRPMTQVEVVKAMQEELNESISQAYLSQLEAGKRVHLTATSRELLARFFKIHPSYLVADPPGFSVDLLTTMDHEGERLTTWLLANAEEWHSESALRPLLLQLAETEQPRRYIKLFNQLMSLPLEKLETMVNAMTKHNSDTTVIN
ncbi:MAG: hypothetical protein JO183_07960 [Ktedonobacteraceae bacterium]|nr:hypothetical protein [Ktedonobacteraceae bacterium]MBV9021476.1 hypothetical protein [Ktedonobacteraceae bacterium]